MCGSYFKNKDNFNFHLNDLKNYEFMRILTEYYIINNIIIL